MFHVEGYFEKSAVVGIKIEAFINVYKHLLLQGYFFCAEFHMQAQPKMGRSSLQPFFYKCLRCYCTLLEEIAHSIPFHHATTTLSKQIAHSTVDPYLDLFLECRQSIHHEVKLQYKTMVA